MNRGGTPRNLRPPWKKGQPSPNPKGRPPAPWREWLAAQEPELREILARMARDGRLAPRDRIRVAEFLLNHTHGQPKQTLEADFPTTMTLSVSKRAYLDLRREGKELPPVLVRDDDGTALTPEELDGGRHKTRG